MFVNWLRPIGQISAIHSFLPPNLTPAPPRLTVILLRRSNMTWGRVAVTLPLRKMYDKKVGAGQVCYWEEQDRRWLGHSNWMVSLPSLRQGMSDSLEEYWVHSNASQIQGDSRTTNLLSNSLVAHLACHPVVEATSSDMQKLQYTAKSWRLGSVNSAPQPEGADERSRNLVFTS